MQDYGHVLCLFCKTGKEQSVAHRISENGVGTAIFPQRIAKRYSKERKAYEEIRTALLPGYVFVYLPDEVPPVNWWTYSGVIRPLGYGDGRRDYLVGSDLAFAQWVCKGRKYQPCEGRPEGRPNRDRGRPVFPHARHDYPRGPQETDLLCRVGYGQHHPAGMAAL